jgi:heterodisulfide reductase subunit A-like polyferredoxin/coenzyme F420-reducing hydrogenase delta subunit
MANECKIGVFLCDCGQRIAPLVDLDLLKQKLQTEPDVAFVGREPYSCLAPGLEGIKAAVREHGLDRLVVAGCEARLMLKKFEEQLAETGLEQGQIDMVNLRGHVAAVHDLSPEEMAEKAFKLICASVAGLKALLPSPKEKVEFAGPVLILGGGIATYAAAQELLRQDIECVLAVQTDEYQDELRMLHEHYPGERHYYDRMEAIMQEVDASTLVRRITVGELRSLTGRTGNFTVTFTSPDDGLPRIYHAGSVIACLDGQMLNQGNNFGHDGKNVICHTEAEEMIWTTGVPGGQIVFWINDYEAGHPEFAYLAARTAWSMGRYMREHSPLTKVTILHNHQMAVPLSAGERKLGRELGINWVAYDGALRPTVQASYITYCDPATCTEMEMNWDKLILSPRRSVGLEVTKVARVLGMEPKEGHFLEHQHAKVRPEMQGREEAFLAGSARYPCDLHEALRQGRRAAQMTAVIVLKAKAGELYAPRMVCVVDQSKCVGCGLCKEICDCGGIEPVEGLGGNVPRHVDPMVCTGGGTCAAACPYHALTLQNNSTAQREARVADLSRRLGPLEALAFGCAWGGLAAADNAGVKGMKYDPRVYMLRVGCIGQLDPSVMARAFLEGAPGLLLIGCPPEECHHSYGVDHTWARVNLVKKLLGLCGLDRRRIALAHADLNQPGQYIRAVEAFVRLMNELGPMERDPLTLERLQGLYDTVNNARVRWVLGAGLRRPWEEVYPGDQRNAMSFDKSFMDVVGEEYVGVRMAQLMRRQSRPMVLGELSQSLREDEATLVDKLREMVSEGLITRTHKDGVAHYSLR